MRDPALVEALHDLGENGCVVHRGGILPKGPAFVDPVVRARLLIKVVEMGENLLNLPTTPQDTLLGLTDHFMHPTVRRAALDQVCCE